MKKYDIAAYIWPSYTGDEPRSRIFWPNGEGEWQTVRTAEPAYESDRQPRIPLLGYQNEADPEVMRQQIDLAADHGVNVFIYDWYWYDRRPFLEQCLDDGFLKAENRERMKFFLMWANHDANYTWDKRISEIQDTPVWLGAADRTQFEIIVSRVIEKYFSQPNYYMIDGCPVFQIYDIDNFISGLGGIDAAKDALSYFRQRTKAAGFPNLHLIFTLWGQRVHNLSGVDGGHMYSGEIGTYLGFEGATNYQFVHFLNIDRDYTDIARDAKDAWEEFSALGMTYYPHVSIGWDNNPRFKEFRPGIVKNNTPAEFEKALRAAKASADAHGVSLITLNSWNEWTETSCLLPDDVNGYGYLNAVKAVFGE